jgi:glycosidase
MRPSARHASALVACLLALALLPLPAYAATFLQHVDRVPDTPTSQQSVRVWVNSNTVFGESVCLEYNRVGTGTFTRVQGSFDTSRAGANWRADIPVFPNGATVRYQLFIANSNTNCQQNTYLFSGFNWQYAVFDGDVQWDGLRHDTFDAYYRAPFGAVPAGTQVTLRFRTMRFDVDAVDVRIYTYSPATNSTSGPVDLPLSYLEDRMEGGISYAIWSRSIATPTAPAILYYKFRVTDRLDVDWYSDQTVDDHDNVNKGGNGSPSDNEPFPAFQLTVYEPSFSTPEWLAEANVYQIFPDRFRNGDPTNDYCVAGSTSGCPTFYGSEGIRVHEEWNSAICDPRNAAGPCPNAFGNQFFGGDLKGIEAQLDYLQELGVDTLYLNPIFSGRSNHRYDTDDFLRVDPALGGDAALASLVTELQRRGMRLILDGVWNHTSSDSLYFDRYGRHPGAGGACESTSSPYRSWFVFHNSNVPCGSADYEGWFGFASLPVLVDGNAQVRDFFYRAPGNVTKHWYDRGVDGWRFDVADEITHDWWREYRGFAKSYKGDGPLIGEVWPNASRFLLGEQLDSVMNYRFRKNVLGFARGVADWGDNDNNGSNRIVPLSPSQFDHALRSVREDYPEPATRAMLNLLGSHDTNRALYVLTFTGDTGLVQTKQRLQLAALFQFTYLGAPMTYYGDEAAINSPSLANGPNGPEDDPYNRAPYPWADEPGDPSIYGPADVAMIGYYGKLAHLRKERVALRQGEFVSLLTGDTTPSSSDNNTFAFARVAASEVGVVAINNGVSSNTASVPVAAYFSDGAVLQDGLSGATHTVSAGNVSLTLAARSGAILFPAPNQPDVTRPLGSIALEPAANTNGWNNSSPVQVQLSATDGGSGIRELRYWVDGGPTVVVAGASATVNVSTDGTTVSLRAVDKAGNVSQLATVTVRIDEDAPTVTIDSAPSSPWASPTIEFEFSADEAGSTFECSLDGTDYAACSSPQAYTDVPDGSHTFSVRAIDPADNMSPAAVAVVEIDTTPPETTLGGGPPAFTSSTSASFTFASSEAGGTFECSLDEGGFEECSSPATYGGLAIGPHRFAVRAIDLAGNLDPTPAEHEWQVVEAYSFDGFLQPVQGPAWVNVVSAGRAVPIRFSLGGYRGEAIFAAGSPSSRPMSCADHSPLGAAAETLTPGSSSLSYDPASDTYTYVWKTDRTWAGSCRQLTVAFADGTTHLLLFRLQR